MRETPWFLSQFIFFESGGLWLIALLLAMTIDMSVNYKPSPEPMLTWTMSTVAPPPSNLLTTLAQSDYAPHRRRSHPVIRNVYIRAVTYKNVFRRKPV